VRGREKGIWRGAGTANNDIIITFILILVLEIVTVRIG